MTCSNCKNEIQKISKFCPYCGIEIIAKYSTDGKIIQNDIINNNENQKFTFFNEETNHQYFVLLSIIIATIITMAIIYSII